MLVIPTVDLVEHLPTSRSYQTKCTCLSSFSASNCCIFTRKRVFILGPSHHVFLPNCALSSATTYQTPLYDLKIDQEGIDQIIILFELYLNAQSTV